MTPTDYLIAALTCALLAALWLWWRAAKRAGENKRWADHWADAYFAYGDRLADADEQAAELRESDDFDIWAEKLPWHWPHSARTVVICVCTCTLIIIGCAVWAAI